MIYSYNSRLIRPDRGIEILTAGLTLVKKGQTRGPMKGHHQGEEFQHAIRCLFHGELLTRCLLGFGAFFSTVNYRSR